MPDTDKLITLERLKDLLAAYGARPAKWPAEERAAALALIETSENARMLFNEEQALDALLEQVAEPEVSEALHGRVRSIAMPSAAASTPSLLTQLFERFRPQSQMAWQGAVVMAGVSGIVVGVSMSAIVMDTGATPTTVVAISGDTVEAEAMGINTVTPVESPNFAYSLTGESVTETETTTDDSNNGDGTFTVAGIPLY